jgi:lipoprotein-anchoring transpeptidase ErfK/SrfK
MSENNPKEDWILTRILWLSGLEIGFNRLGNQDTMQRFIYIHGTNDLARLGQPVSHGCIRMDNQDIIDLFDQINAGDHVLISEI